MSMHKRSYNSIVNNGKNISEYDDFYNCRSFPRSSASQRLTALQAKLQDQF